MSALAPTVLWAAYVAAVGLLAALAAEHAQRAQIDTYCGETGDGPQSHEPRGGPRAAGHLQRVEQGAEVRGEGEHPEKARGPAQDAEYRLDHAGRGGRQQPDGGDVGRPEQRAHSSSSASSRFLSSLRMRFISAALSAPSLTSCVRSSDGEPANSLETMCRSALSPAASRATLAK